MSVNRAYITSLGTTAILVACSLILLAVQTGLRVSAIGIGCWQMGGLVGGGAWTGMTDEESIATIHRAQELDINLLDTAESYGAGHSETVIGQALKGRRDKFYQVSCIPWMAFHLLPRVYSYVAIITS